MTYLDPYTRSAFYCSQLVWAGFIDKYGVDLNTSLFGNAIHPIELVQTPLTTLLYKDGPTMSGWQKVNGYWYYFDANGNVVPTTNLATGRLSGANRYQTAALASNQFFTSATNVVIASGNAANFPDALAAAPLAKLLNAPILLSDTSLNAYTINEIQRLGASNIYIMGGTAAVSAVVQNTLCNSYGKTVYRYAGNDRYDTARLIANKVIALRGAANVTGVFLAIGTDFPDALSASAAAATKGLPIVFATPNSTTLSSYTASIVALSAVKTAYIIGGTAVIPTGLESTLKSSYGITSVSRFAGVDRYDTNKRVNESTAFFATRPTYHIAATGTSFPDALAGGAIGGRYSSPIVLTDPYGPNVSSYTLVYIKAHMPVSGTWIMGGHDAVDELAGIRLTRILP